MLFIGLNLLAIGSHVYSTLHYYDLKLGLGGESAICNINAYFSCDTITASAYSSLLGIPIALFGVATHLVLLTLAVMRGMEDEEISGTTSRWISRVITLVLGANIVMASISFGVIGRGCLFCMMSYVLSLLIFASGYFWIGLQPFKHLAGDFTELFTERRGLLAVMIVIPFLTLSTHKMLLQNYGFSRIDLFIADQIANWQSSPVRSFDLTQGLIISNSDKPKMTIVEFADFRCPHCRAAREPVKAFVNAHPDVRLIFKTFPLDGVCNPAKALEGRGDGISCALAQMVMCMQKKANMGWKVHDLFFEQQITISSFTSPQQVADFVVSKLGTDKSVTQACLNDQDALASVRQQAKEGEAADIRGTPSFFVDQKELNPRPFIPALEAVYDILNTKTQVVK